MPSYKGRKLAIITVGRNPPQLFYQTSASNSSSCVKDTYFPIRGIREFYLPGSDSNFGYGFFEKGVSGTEATKVEDGFDPEIITAFKKAFGKQTHMVADLGKHVESWKDTLSRFKNIDTLCLAMHTKSGIFQDKEHEDAVIGLKLRDELRDIPHFAAKLAELEQTRLSIDTEPDCEFTSALQVNNWASSKGVELDIPNWADMFAEMHSAIPPDSAITQLVATLDPNSPELSAMTDLSTSYNAVLAKHIATYKQIISSTDTASEEYTPAKLQLLNLTKLLSLTSLHSAYHALLQDLSDPKQQHLYPKGKLPATVNRHFLLAQMLQLCRGLSKIKLEEEGPEFCLATESLLKDIENLRTKLSQQEELTMTELLKAIMNIHVYLKKFPPESLSKETLEDIAKNFHTPKPDEEPTP